MKDATCYDFLFNNVCKSRMPTMEIDIANGDLAHVHESDAYAGCACSCARIGLRNS